MRSSGFFGAFLALVLLSAGTFVTFGAEDEKTSDEQHLMGEQVISDRLLVGFHEAPPAWFEDWARDRSGEVFVRDDRLQWAGVQFDDAQTATDARGDLEHRAEVRYVEPDALMELQFIEDAGRGPLPLFPEHEPDDPYYGIQWGFPGIKAPQAWGTQKGDHDVSVAVLDTGIERDHPDLADNICGPHESFVSDAGASHDAEFHGTHVAGSVAAVSDNALGVAGTSQSCLMDVQVCEISGLCPHSASSVGIRWAADNGAHIISMSFGGFGFSEVMQDAVSYASGQGVLLVAAAGNSYCDGPGTDTVHYPAKYPEVIAVSALRSPGLGMAPFSSCGPAVELAGPGLSVYSTDLHGGYRYSAGTSMAVPHVSGVAALVKSEHPGLSAADIRCTLARTADDVIRPGPDIDSGWGRVNAVSALTLGTVPPTPHPIQVGAPDAESGVYLAANSCVPVGSHL